MRRYASQLTIGLTAQHNGHYYVQLGLALVIIVLTSCASGTITKRMHHEELVGIDWLICSQMPLERPRCFYEENEARKKQVWADNVNGFYTKAIMEGAGK